MEELNYKKINIEYFDKIAPKWDSVIYHDPRKIDYFFENFPINKEDNVLDVGTGTGILIPYIIKRLGKDGKLFAIDISSKMIEIARKRHRYPNLIFILGDVEEYDFTASSFDKIICYSVFPHFLHREKVIAKFYKLLTPGGLLSIFHSASREYINNIHRENGFHFEKNILPPAKEISDIMSYTGFSVSHCEDTENLYLVIGKK